MKPYICKQCGAPMNNPYKCEYCDTVYRNDYSDYLNFELMKTEQRIRDLQSQIIVDRLKFSQNMCGQIIDFNPHWDVKDNICNIPKPTKPPTTYSWFQFFKKIIEKIGGKRNDK